MNRRDRWDRLLELLAADRHITIDKTARNIGVSAATIRRDLDELARQHLLIRTRGGARVNNVSYDLPIRHHAAHQNPQVQRIAAAAAALVPAGSTVGINGGTINTEVARALAARPLPQPDQRVPALTVVTNALNIAAELVLRPHITVVVTGGTTRPRSFQLTGSVTSDMLRTLALDFTILDVDAVHHTHGASCDNDDEAHVNAVMAAHSAHIIVVAEPERLGQRAFVRSCPITAIRTIVTTTSATRQQTDRFEAQKIIIVRS